MGLPSEQFEQFKAGAIPIKELMNGRDGLSPVYKKRFKSVDVVFGYDNARPDDPAAMTVFYGRGFLQEVAHSKRSEPMQYVVVSYDQRTDELEKLCACCQVHRGECDYGRSSGFNRP